MSAFTHHRARVAYLSRFRAADDPELLEARLSLTVARFAERIALELGRIADTGDVDQLATHAADAMPELSEIELDALGKLADELRARYFAGDDAPATP